MDKPAKPTPNSPLIDPSQRRGIMRFLGVIFDLAELLANW
jgi:hypothetical protein